MNKTPLMLIILDGWGINPSRENNAIALASTPHYDAWLKEYPHAALDASGKAVGLPAGVMGNSEVGHLNIGAGRVALVGLTRIYHSIEDGSFFKNPELLSAFASARKNSSTLHLMGLLSDGGVHSHQDHLYTLLQMAKQQGVEKVAIHAFMDGRDTPPTSGLDYLRQLQAKLLEFRVGAIATVIGRYYAMDRDKRWERTQLAYRAMVEGQGVLSGDPLKSIEASYQAKEGDEFIKPIVHIDAQGKPIGNLQDGDAVIFFNFRADRARQISHALTDPEFSGFPPRGLP